MDHTDVLNGLIEKHGLKKYLEIGVQNPKNNFDLIKAPYKAGVDPRPFNRYGFVGTSDDFFLYTNIGLIKYDLIFIDGLHHSDQAERDFNNSMFHLSDGGFIVLHDTLPESEHLTHVPRDKKGRWLGDVYKTIMLLNAYDGIDFYTLPFDNGITVVWRDETKTGDKERIAALEPIGWQTYQQNMDLMRVST